MSEALDILQLIDNISGEVVTYKVATQWYDGTLLDNSKIDGVIFRKKGSTFYKRQIDSKTILKIQNITDLRNTDGYYEGQEITLLGYYVSGDKTPLNYKFTIEPSLVDDGGSVIKSPKGYWKAQFGDIVHTSHFGLAKNYVLSPTDVGKVIQATFDFSFTNNKKRVVISEGTHIVKSESLFYRIPDSTLEFEGILKLQDNDSVVGALTGCRIIAYTANNITVINQKLDGNRDNQVHNSQVGTQFSFTGYGYISGIKFIGGYCINSIQSHCQFIAKNIEFENYTLNNSGEHGIYYSLNVNGLAGENIKMNNCTISNIGKISGGHCISLRAVKTGEYNNCIFDEGVDVGGSCIGVSVYYTYRNAFPSPTEEFKHIFNSCSFKPSNRTIYSVGARLTTDTDDANPYTIREYLKRGQGIFLNDCNITSYVGLGILKATKTKFNYPIDNTFTHSRLPLSMESCEIYNLYRYMPSNVDDVYDMNITDTLFSNSNTNSRVVFDANSIPLMTSKIFWSFKNSNFIGYTTQTSLGIIRNSSTNTALLELTVMGNKLINCSTSVFVNIGSSNNNFIGVNNSDVSKSGVTFRFAPDSKPSIVDKNDFIKHYGTTSERPTGTALSVGYIYYNTDLKINEIWNGGRWDSREGITILNIEDVTKYVSQYSPTSVRGSGYIYFGGNTNANKANNITNIALDSNGITISSTRACITTVDTSIGKSFKVSTITSDPNVTRIGVRCFNQSGVLIDNTTTTTPVISLEGNTFFWSEDFKMWRTTSFGNDISFKVDPTVYKIDVIIVSVSTVRLDSFKIINFDGKAKMLDKYGDSLLSTVTPTVVSKDGTFYYNSNNALKIHGWIYMNSSWVSIPKMSQSTAVADVTASNASRLDLNDLENITTADATDLATALVLLNELKTKYNLNVTMVNDIKSKYNVAYSLINSTKNQLNAKLAADRASDQQV